jgi:hypothetical protein
LTDGEVSNERKRGFEKIKTVKPKETLLIGDSTYHRGLAKEYRGYFDKIVNLTEVTTLEYLLIDCKLLKDSDFDELL